MHKNIIMYFFSRYINTSIISILACVSALCGAANAGDNTKLTVIHEFKGGVDGCATCSTPAMDAAGSLYGMTTHGGRFGYGQVFRLSPPAAGQTKWTKTAPYDFKGGKDGFPVEDRGNGDLIVDANGAVYGTTWRGGDFSAGVVFRIAPPLAGQTTWRETVLWSFKGGTAGGYPEGGLVMDAAGALYGTTNEDGANYDGAIFKLTPPAAGRTLWSKSVLYRFNGKPDGKNPRAKLVADPQGVLYGTTQAGGLYDQGSVFQLTPPAQAGGRWKKTQLISFASLTSPRTSWPFAPVTLDAKGSLYGATSFLWPAVYKLTPPAAGRTLWSEKTLYYSSNNKDVKYPPLGTMSGLALNSHGILYGASNLGGTPLANDLECGAVFQLE